MPGNDERRPPGQEGGAPSRPDSHSEDIPVVPLIGRDAWLVVVTEPGRRGTWHVLRTREKTALATANRHRDRDCDVKVFRAHLTVEDEVAW